MPTRIAAVIASLGLVISLSSCGESAEEIQARNLMGKFAILNDQAVCWAKQYLEVIEYEAAMSETQEMLDHVTYQQFVDTQACYGAPPDESRRDSLDPNGPFFMGKILEDMTEFSKTAELLQHENQDFLEFKKNTAKTVDRVSRVWAASTQLQQMKIHESTGVLGMFNATEQHKHEVLMIDALKELVNDSTYTVLLPSDYSSVADAGLRKQ